MFLFDASSQPSPRGKWKRRAILRGRGRASYRSRGSRSSFNSAPPNNKSLESNQQTWTCTECLFENKGTATKCGICARPKSNKKDIKKDEPNKFNADEIIFKIWSIISGINSNLMAEYLSISNIKTLKDLQKLSLFILFQQISTINWSKYDISTKRNLLQNIEKVRKMNLSSNIQSIPPPSRHYSHHSYPTPMIHRPSRRARGGASWGGPSYQRMQRSMARDAFGSNNRFKSAAPCPPTVSLSSMQQCAQRNAPCRRGRPCRPCRPPMANREKSIGFAVGGAQDINSFRDNILKGHRVPKLNAITFEGIYADYYFNTDGNQVGDNVSEDEKDGEGDREEEELPLFYPSYCYAKSLIPDALMMMNRNSVIKRPKKVDMIEDTEDDMNIDRTSSYDENYDYFMTVGLNSNIKEKDFQRKKLNLVIVLDISGSMSCRFNNDRSGLSKMQTANQCVLSVITNLNENDRFGLVLFDHDVQVFMDFKTMKDHNIQNFQNILNITSRGATNFELGYKKGLQMFNEYPANKEYENRLILLTDACPNYGATDPNSLMSMVKREAMKKRNRIYTTFVGVGLDFNADLIAEISKVRGANYFAVHSSADFLKRVHGEFEYIVSPMVFDLKLSLQSEGDVDNSCIEAVYGSNDIDVKSGEIMNINTLFPSPPNEDGEIKGGIVLIKLKKSERKNLKNVFIECSFEDKNGKKFKNKQYVTFNQDVVNQEYYGNNGVRKGIVLTRFVLLMKQWIKDHGPGRNLSVSHKYKQIFKYFSKYFEEEMKYLNDDTLNQEMKILQKLIKM